MGRGGGYPSQVSMGYPPPWNWLGYSHVPTPPLLGLDGGTLLPIRRQSSRVNTCTPRAVSILRSRRRTFLYKFKKLFCPWVGPKCLDITERFYKFPLDNFWWLVRVTLVVDWWILPQNFGPVVGTYEGLLWLCEWTLGGDFTCRWWGHISRICDNWSFSATGGGGSKT